MAQHLPTTPIGDLQLRLTDVGHDPVGKVWLAAVLLGLSGAPEDYWPTTADVAQLLDAFWTHDEAGFDAAFVKLDATEPKPDDDQRRSVCGVRLDILTSLVGSRDVRDQLARQIIDESTRDLYEKPTIEPGATDWVASFRASEAQSTSQRREGSVARATADIMLSLLADLASELEPVQQERINDVVAEIKALTNSQQ